MRYEQVGRHIALITLDRPEKRNAVTPQMAQDLDALVKRTERDPEIRVVILASSSAVFCAGADLAEVAKGNATGLRTADGGFAGLALARHAKPWIAEVPGAALAGGTEIVLACDIVLATPQATFGLPEVRRGLVAGAGGVFRLPRLVPRNIAIEMIATGLPIDSQRAHQFGLVNRIVERNALREASIAMAHIIAENAPLAVVESLAIARVAQQLPEDRLRDLAAETARRILATDDSREGARAFVEKRPPVWAAR